VLTALLFVYTYKNYGGIGADEFKELVEHIRTWFEDSVNSYMELTVEQLNNMPDSPIKEISIDRYRQIKSVFEDTDMIIDMFLYILPGIVIFAANIYSYIASTMYYLSIREGSGHVVFSTPDRLHITVSVVGTIIFDVGFFLFAIGSFLSTTLGVLGLNFVLIYLPALFLTGLKSILNPQIRKQNKFLIIGVIITLFFNPIFAFLLVGFIGANTVISNFMLNFMKNHFFDEDNK